MKQTKELGEVWLFLLSYRIKITRKIFYILVVFPTFEGYFNEDDFSRI